MNTRIHLILPAILLMMIGCTNQEPPVEKVNESLSTASGGLFLSAEQINYAGIEYGSISERKLSYNVNARGKLVLPLNAIIDHVSQYAGLVKAVHTKEGQYVRKGQLLVTLISPEFVNAQQRYLMVKNELVMLEQEYERQKELNKDKIASDKLFEKARADYNVALAELTGLGIQLSLANIDIDQLKEDNIAESIEIHSQQDGYVERVTANPGKYVMVDECLMQVINRDHLLVELSVFEKDIMLVQTGQKVSFTLSNLGNEVYKADIISIGNIVDEDNRVVRVLAEFKNSSGRMLPGMFVASEIHTGEEVVEALPEEALVRREGNEWIIFYTTEEEQGESGTTFHTANVKPGTSQNGYIEVMLEQALPIDSKIVVSGAYFLKTEQAKQAE